MAAINYKRRRQDDQSTITRYFGVTTTSSSSPSTSTSSHAPARSLAPELPKQVQSSLLSVGARVRKAMAEADGLRKDGSPFKMGTPLSRDGTTSSTTPSDEEAVKSRNGLDIPVPVPYATARPELFPFCGSYKTGDIDPSTYNYNPGASRLLKRSHSQTVPSVVGFDAQQDGLSDEEDGFFPETDVVFATQTPPPPSARPVAKGPGFIEGDFEEAPFLKSREEVDML
ncbi:hypothetical protein KEM56_006926 [Ascosphaera pollenicola]|nr:hypothetical protein KEM56_006926 [Ascosphaera pollenicola]